MRALRNGATTLLALAGDVMTGRGIDQAMPQPSEPTLYEPCVRDARDYIDLAERVNGPIGRPLAPDHIWGDALAELGQLAPDARIVNLETAVTRSDRPWPGKGIHYRMQPAHASCLTAGRIDACSLANNHVLDWSHAGLDETLATLHGAGIATAGAGADLARAEAPAVLAPRDGVRVLVFAWATTTSGVPDAWAATARGAGVALLPDLGDASADRIAAHVLHHKRRGDIAVVSLHWGANWVPAVPAEHRRFAHRLIDSGAADIVHGHSSHHPLPVEVHAGKLILAGCGDLINDYEGIETNGRWRSDLGCWYLPEIDDRGLLRRLEIVPLQVRRFRLEHADAAGRAAIARELTAGARVELREAGTRWRLQWS